MMTDINLTDIVTCYKTVRANLLKSLALRTNLLKSLALRTNQFGIEPELTARLAQAGARIYEVPISYHGHLCRGQEDRLARGYSHPATSRGQTWRAPMCRATAVLASPPRSLIPRPCQRSQLPPRRAGQRSLMAKREGAR
jgi:hypothetical protein